MVPVQAEATKYIYVVFISTNTIMGKGIRLFTRNRYSHITVSLDRNLSAMYSFARYYINSPIRGGFVTERPGRYLYKDQDVLVKICEVPVKLAEYDRIRREIEYFQSNREIMIYNTINALLSLLGKRLAVKNMYTCLEFATYLLGYPNMNAIRELERRLEEHIIYTGSFRGIADWEQEQQNEDEYFRRRRATGICYDTVYHVRSVVGRVLRA